MRSWTVGVAMLGMFLAGGAIQGSIIDFESGFSDGQAVGMVATADNQVTFSIGPDANSLSTAYIAEVGSPTSAFVPRDTPATAVAGDFFLSDENDQDTVGLTVRRNYFMTFATAVTKLGFDTFDIRTDGGGQAGDQAILTVYSDAAFSTAVGSDVFTVVSGLVDGNVANLSVLNPTGGLIRSASLVFWRGGSATTGTDVGTGIDNVTFSTVPEPGTLVIWSLLGVIGIVAGRLRRRS